jgi:hypothetical protein
MKRKADRQQPAETVEGKAALCTLHNKENRKGNRNNRTIPVINKVLMIKPIKVIILIATN